MLREPLPVTLEDEDDEDKAKKEGASPIGLDLLKNERSLIISEEVSPKLTQRLLSCLLWLDSQSHDPIKIFINTPGGSADDGFAIHDAIRYVQSPVYNVTLGLNASAGIIILLSVPKERRFALPSTRLMMHQPSGGGRGQSAGHPPGVRDGRDGEVCRQARKSPSVRCIDRHAD